MALRTPLSVTPHLYMGDSTGRPLDNGVVYFGQQDKDPEFYPIDLYSDDELTKQLAQPIHTKGGYLYDKGDMVEPHAKEIIYSVKVLDGYGRKVFYKGAMMRNSWNDDVIQQINTAIIESQEEAVIAAQKAVEDAINNTSVADGVLADTFVTATASGIGSAARTQRSKNSDVKSSADFGIVANSPLDQTAKMDAFTDYLRANNCKGIMPVKGTIKLTANKQRTFGVIGEVNYQVVNYAVDASGIELDGLYNGYENVDGTILDIQGTGVGFFQAKETLSSCTYALSGFKVINATCALHMTYALFCNIKNFVYKDCVNAIILGENTFTAGAIGNIFTNVYGKCTGAPLKMIGTKWNNANQFFGCFFTGDAPSIIDVTGGYGAISNTFWGGEFTTIAGSTAAAIVIGNSRSTNFVGTFFEPKSHAIIIDGQAKKLMINSCTLGSTRNNATLSPEPCMIWHKSGSASLTVIGGSVFLGDATGLQDNMRLVYSSDPTQFDCTIVDNPFVFLTGTTGWKYVTLDNLAQFRSFSGQITESTPVSFSTAGASISNLTSDSKVTYQITGNLVNVSIYIGLQTSSVLGAGDYYINLKMKPKERSVGTVMYNKAGSATIFGGSNISANNNNLFLRVPTVSSTYNDTTKTVASTLGSSYTSSTTLAGYNTTGSSLYGQIAYTI